MYSFGLVLLYAVCGAKDVQLAKDIAVSMVDERASVNETIQLMQHVRVQL